MITALVCSMQISKISFKLTLVVVLRKLLRLLDGSRLVGGHIDALVHSRVNCWEVS